MNSMGHKVARALLVILLCTGLPQLIPGQSKKAIAESHRASVERFASPQYEAEEKSLKSIFSHMQEDPLQMMVYGLVLFAIATTFRRIKSKNRVQAHLKANKSNA